MTGITINDYTLVWNAVSLGATVNSSPINLYKITSYAIQLVWTGTPVGTFKLQGSCDQGSDAIGTGVTNWDDIPGASQAAGGAASSVGFNYQVQPGYNWVRVVYTRSSSTGTVTAKYNGKG